ILQISFFSFTGFFFLLILYSMLFYALRTSMNIPIKFPQITYPFSYVFSTILLFPIFEEFFYRRLLAHHFFEKYGLKRAVFYSAFLFTITHDLSHGGLLDIFLFGSICAYIYLKTRNVYIVLVLHMLNNFCYILFSGTITPLIVFFEDYKHLNYFWWYYALGLLMSITIFYYSFRYINRYYAKYISEEPNEK
ncbi:MAG: CPBP family intramembrane glutamic endopeptidase, partial [Polaribacter sp.]